MREWHDTSASSLLLPAEASLDGIVYCTSEGRHTLRPPPSTHSSSQYFLSSSMSAFCAGQPIPSPSSSVFLGMTCCEGSNGVWKGRVET